MPVRVLRRLLITLSVLTVAALLWNRFGMESRLVVDARTSLAIEAVTDRGREGGRSVATVVRDGRRFGLDCQIAVGVRQPSCELVVRLRHPPAGVNLGDYQSVRLWVSADGPEKEPRLRLVLRDFNPVYSRVGEPLTQKVNEIEFAPSRYLPGHEIPLGRFTVPGWWSQTHPTAPEFSGPELDNVTTFSLSTGSDAEPGMHRITLERVEFVGKLVSPATFRLVLLAAWLLAALGYVVVDLLPGRNPLRLSSASQDSLERLNQSLSVQTRSLAELARTDPLTGVLNRKGLADELLELVRGGGDAIFPLTLVFIDIDHFKRVNDEHGHDVGDQVIKGLAQLVRSAVQRDDLFARWGGEEFLLVFRNTPGLEARTIAERLRERIADAQWPVSLRVTCSFGVAEWHEGEELDRGVRRADTAMYRAKQNGRDRVEIQLDLEPSASDFGGLSPL